MAMAAMICWLPGPARACDFVSTLNVLGSNDLTSSQKSEETTYGKVDVTISNLVSGHYTTATVTITPTESPLDLDFNNGSSGPGNSAALNLNPAYVTVNSSHVSGVDESGKALTLTLNSASSYDGLGTFNVIGTLPGSNSNQESMTYTITGGDWTSANQVLLANGSDFDAGVYVEVAGTSNTAYIGEDVPAVPGPPTALLLGSGLMGLALLGLRRKGTAFGL